MDDVVCKHGWSRRFCEPCSSAYIISQLKGPRHMGMLAIKPDQIPLEVKRAMRAAWARRNNSDAPEKHMADLAVAALNAWPGMVNGSTRWPHRREIILPLPQENSDD